MPARHAFHTGNFTCHIRCGQCRHIKADGNRCGNRTCFGWPLCWIHNKVTYGVQPKMQRTLKASKPFQPGDWICPYGAKNRITTQCLNQRYPGNTLAPFVITPDPAHPEHGTYVRDAACTRGVGAQAAGRYRLDGTPAPNQHNSEIVHRQDRNNKLWLRATRNIRAGREIIPYLDPTVPEDYNSKTALTTKPDSRPC